MFLLLNNDELAEPLARIMIRRYLRKLKPNWSSTNEYLEKCQGKTKKSGLIEVDFSKVNECIRKDLNEYQVNIIKTYKKTYRPLVRWLTENLEKSGIDQRFLIKQCIDHGHRSFVKLVGSQLTDQGRYITRTDDRLVDWPILIRNTVHNEVRLAEKIKNKRPFWFIDSGYTNFLTDKKQWHRLVNNHLHQHLEDLTKFPADRLQFLSSFPRPWTRKGDTILVVENSEQHYRIFNKELSSWKDWIVDTLRKHTDLPIEFKPKEGDRKTRQSVWELINENPNKYCCVISDSSAAAIEAVWAGVPIITLGQHISTPVARTQLEDINNLYRGTLGNWLCALTYSQFTAEEMYNGTALKFIKKYHV
jgi:hypothetical protein